MQLMFFTINFVVFIFLLVLLLKKPVSKYLKERKDSFINGHKEAQKLYDDALLELNKMKENIRNISKDGKIHIEEASNQAKTEANTIILNARSYSKAMLTGTDEMIKSEEERAKNREITNFIHSVIAKTKDDVKNEASQKDYDAIYIKDYFAEDKRVNI